MNRISHLIPRCENCGSASEFEMDLPSIAGLLREKRRCIDPDCHIPFTVGYEGDRAIHNA